MQNNTFWEKCLPQSSSWVLSVLFLVNEKLKKQEGSVMQKSKTKILKEHKEGLGIALKLYVKTRCTLSQ